MAVRIDTTFSEQRALDALRYMRNLGENPEPLLDILGNRLLVATERRFDEGVSPSGTPWPISRRADFQGGQTLVDRGDLRDSLRYEVRPDAVEIGVDGTSQSSRFAYVLHYGAVIVPRNASVLAFTGPNGHKVFAHRVEIPARPFLGVNDQDRADVADDWITYVRSRLK